MTANGTVLYRHKTYVDSAQGKLVGARRAIGRTTGNPYIELHIESDTGECLAINMPEEFNPPVDLITGKFYDISWIEDAGVKRLSMDFLNPDTGEVSN